MASPAGSHPEAGGWPESESRRSALHRSRSFSRENRHAMARPTRAVRPLEVGLQSIQQLGEEGALGGDLQGAAARCRRGRLNRRWLRCSRTPRCVGRKRGVQSNALGRSRGGFSTKLHAVVDTKFLPCSVTRHDLARSIDHRYMFFHRMEYGFK